MEPWTVIRVLLYLLLWTHTGIDTKVSLFEVSAKLSPPRTSYRQFSTERAGWLWHVPLYCRNRQQNIRHEWGQVTSANRWKCHWTTHRRKSRKHGEVRLDVEGGLGYWPIRCLDVLLHAWLDAQTKTRCEPVVLDRPPIIQKWAREERQIVWMTVELTLTKVKKKKRRNATSFENDSFQDHFY